MDSYKLIDITSYTSKKGVTYYIAVVYFVYDNGFSDVLRIILDSEEQADFLKQYMGEDISSLIVIKYNGYRKQFIPSIKKFE